MTTKRVVNITLLGSTRSHTGENVIETHDLDRSLKAAARKIPCYGISGRWEKGFLVPATMTEVLSNLDYGGKNVPVVIENDQWSAKVTVTSDHPAVRKCDMVDLFGVAGVFGLISWGSFKITVEESTSRLSKTRQAALLSSSNDLDGRTDLGIQNMRVYNEVSKRPFLDLSKLIESNLLSGKTPVAKMLTPGEDRHECLANH